MKNYYNILHVSSAADEVQIKKAYRSLCMRYHPDRHGGSAYHEEKFKEINEAYRVLIDPGKRTTYNRQLTVRVRPRSRSLREVRPRSSSYWGPPEFASEAKSQSFHCPSATDNRGGGFFWSVILLLVFFIPAWLSSGSVESNLPPLVEQVGYDMTERLDQRFKQEVYYLNEMKRIDPDLEGLDMDTGYYQLNGKTIRLSWDILELVRKNGWKVRS